MKVQPTTRELIEMLYERLPALFDRAAPVEPDYKQLYEQVCEQYDVLAKELEATNRQVEILSDALAESRREVAAPVREDWGPGPHEAHSLPPAAPVQEPVGTYGEIFESMLSLLRTGLQRDQQIYMAMEDKPLYATPPAANRPWVGLTQDEFRDFASTLDYGTGGLIRAIEAKLREKNT